MRTKTFFVSVFILVLCPALAFSNGCSNEDFATTPPFLSQPVSPNILFVVDKSGSMGWTAYSFGAAVYDSAKTYEGYFDPAVRYELDTGVWVETTDANTCTVGPDNGDDPRTVSGICSGNELNFAVMDRVDVLRWALTGGRPTTCVSETDSTCDPEIECTGATCDIITNTGHTVRARTERVTGLTRTFADSESRPRFALLFYDSDIYDHKVYAGDYPDGGDASSDTDHPYTYFNRYINYISPGGGTGTGPAMWEAYDYFKQNNDHDYSNGFSIVDNQNPFRDPLNFCDWDKGNCVFTPCAKNYVILATDGAWNRGGEPIESTCDLSHDQNQTPPDSGYSPDPVVPAHKMHTDLLRTVTSLSGNSTFEKRVDAVYTLGLFMGGTGLQSIRHTALFGSFDTQDGTQTWPNWATGTPLTDYLTANCAMDDCGNGTSSACASLPVTSLDWDAQDTNGVPGADNIPDTFIDAQSGQQMRDSLTQALNAILTNAGSGSALSVLADRTTSGLALHQALFFPKKDYSAQYSVDWLGTLNSYWFYNSNLGSNIREDNINPFILDITGDNILDFVIGTAGDLTINYWSADTDGLPLTQLGTYADVDAINKIFDSGAKLRDRAASTRTIYGVNESGTMSLFTKANYALFDSNFGQTADFPQCLGTAGLGATDQSMAENLISYIRGAADDFSSASGFACIIRQVRDPVSDTDGAGYRWKLGDIIHSTPALVQYGPSISPSRSVVYVTSNDGMLHAFETGVMRTDNLTSDQLVRLCEENTPTPCATGNIGKELWSFIPQNVQPYLRFITDPTYQHIYTHDLTPYAINHGSKKIIVGGMRFGGAAGCVYDSQGRWCGDQDPGDKEQVVAPYGDPATPHSNLGLSSYYALDVTDPDNPIFLWEFNHPDLGFTYSGPAYIKRGGETYVMFTNGPLNYRGETAGSQGSVDAQAFTAFILKVDPVTFELVDANNDSVIDDNDTFKFTSAAKTGFVAPASLSSYNSSFGGRMFTNGVDHNGDGDTDVVFFGINDANGTAGQVLALVPYDGLRSDLVTPNYDPTNKIDVGGGAETPFWEFDTVFNSLDTAVTSKIVYGECFDNPFIYFGTGRWFYKDDDPGQNSNDTETLYGVLVRDCLTDLAAGGNCSINYSNNSNNICNEVANLDDETTLGWQIDGLTPRGNNFLKERTTTDPTFDEDADIVFFTTMQPSESVCDFGGRSRMWAINCMSGSDIWSGCPGFLVDVPQGSLLLQLSGGNIEKASLDQTDFNSQNNMTTDWYVGTPPESGTPFVPPPGPNPPGPGGGFTSGDILLWIER